MQRLCGVRHSFARLIAWISVILTLLMSFSSCERPAADTPGIALRIVELTNRERANQGLPPLAIDPGLDKLALTHSRNMALQGFYAHKDKQGREVADRQKDIYPLLIHLGIGENIHTKGARYQTPTAEEFVQDWMESPGHRKNILNESYTHIGVGVFEGRDAFFATQVFATEMLRLRALPDSIARVGSRVRVEFEYVSNQPRDLFKSGMRVPNPNEEIEVGGGYFYKGFKPIEPRWSGGRRGTVVLELEHGAGKYSWDAGWGDGYYSDLVVIRAR